MIVYCTRRLAVRLHSKFIMMYSNLTCQPCTGTVPYQPAHVDWYESYRKEELKNSSHYLLFLADWHRRNYLLPSTIPPKTTNLKLLIKTVEPCRHFKVPKPWPNLRNEGLQLVIVKEAIMDTKK